MMRLIIETDKGFEKSLEELSKEFLRLFNESGMKCEAIAKELICSKPAVKNALEGRDWTITIGKIRRLFELLVNDKTKSFRLSANQGTHVWGDILADISTLDNVKFIDLCRTWGVLSFHVVFIFEELQ